MADEVWPEDVVSKLKVNFEAIAGPAYWYKPDIVIRHHEISTALLKDEHPVIYALSPFEIQITESTGQEVDVTLLIDFMLARKHNEADAPYEWEKPLRWTVQDRLAWDFVRCILADVTLGGLVTNVNFQFTLLNFQATYFSRWAIVVGQIAPTHRLAANTLT